MARLVLRSLRYYWRTHLGITLGAAIGAAVIVGALAIGDSVSYSLRQMALLRLGKIHLAMASPDRFFRDALGNEVAAAIGVDAVAVLQMRGLAAQPDGSARASPVQVLGIPDEFWALATVSTDFEGLQADEIILNHRLARQLQAKVGDTVLIRVEKPGTLPRDMPLAPDDDTTAVLTGTVRAIASDDALGPFTLQASQISPHNAFVSRAWMQQRLELLGRANLIVMGPGASRQDAQDQLKQQWQLADAELDLHVLSDDFKANSPEVELRSRRVFIDSTIGQALDGLPGRRILTYFVNELRLGDRTVPYSIVTALEPKDTDKQILGEEPDDHEIVINQWLAEDLAANINDVLEITYFIVDSNRQLVERSAQMHIGRIVPIEGLAADRKLMPNFPGLADAKHCRDWKPGIPINLDLIRDRDEQYWAEYGGTPKAFVTLQAGRRLWNNRFGNLTAIRLTGSQWTPERVEDALRQRLTPDMLGLRFEDVRAAALQASDEALDFGLLFLSLSFFLLVAAVLLTGLLFVFGIDQRRREVGLLLALGWTPGQVNRLLLAEGAVLAAVGCVVGSMGGIGYTRIVLIGLATIWSDAVATATIRFHAEPTKLLLGGACGFIMAVAAMAWTLRRVGKHSVMQILAAGPSAASSSGPVRKNARRSIVLASVLAVGATAMMAWVRPETSHGVAAMFFMVGVLWLLCGLTLSHACLSQMGWGTGTHRSVAALGLTNAQRHRGRSLATICLLACGVYLVVSIDANRLSVTDAARGRRGGTGGFALFGESALPVLHNLTPGVANTEIQVPFGLEPQVLQRASIVQMRVQDGDDASCLNLNRAQKPRLVGVPAPLLQSRGAFTFSKTIDSVAPYNEWGLLDLPRTSNDPVPGIADEATVKWALGKKLGGTIKYTDERGRPFDVQIVAMLANSILQGNILISEQAFLKRFPLSSGHRMFLIDTPTDQTDAVRKNLSRAMEDVGMQLTPTAARLARFNGVQNTYLSIFKALGGLALILASGGLGMVVMRNVLERQPELALMRAVGFNRSHLHWMLFCEHSLLLAMGLVCGWIAAQFALLPVASGPGPIGGIASTTMLVLGVLISGMAWITLAAWSALRKPLLAPLRRE